MKKTKLKKSTINSLVTYGILIFGFSDYTGMVGHRQCQPPYEKSFGSNLL